MSNPIIKVINPLTFSAQEINAEDIALIKNFNIYSNFGSPETYAEYHIYDSQNLIFSNLNYTNYSVLNNPSQAGLDNDSIDSISEIDLKIISDLENNGINEGILNIIYLFFKKKFGSSPFNKFFIKEISSDRTELRLFSNSILPEDVTNGYTNYSSDKANNAHFNDYRLNFGENNLFIAVNFLTEIDPSGNLNLLVKLYEPLPLQFDIKSELWIIEEAANALGYNVEFPFEPIEFDDKIFLKGPNLNIDLLDQINNSTTYKNYDNLVLTTSTSSLNQLKSLLEDKSVQINVDYESYSNFIKFSSVKARLNNFYSKVKSIEGYRNDINSITTILGPTTSSIYYSSSLKILEDKVTDLIENLDGYEYFLYFESSSYAWPKTNLNPVILSPTGSLITQTWFNTQLSSSIIYDNQNRDYLVYTIPEYLRTDIDNGVYLDFVEMIGQHFDNIFIYLKSITDKLISDNRLTAGVAQDLTAEVLKSLGLKIYQNNFTIENLYASFLGVNPNLSLQLTGSELITTYVTASISGSLSSSIVPIDNLNKSIYKRLYHNLPYLLKKKGTVEGLKTLINLYGIPNTLLKINEYGGKDTINFNNYDYYFERYSHAFETHQQAQPIFPWLPLYRNLISEGNILVPDAIEFRFKTYGIPNTAQYSQSLLLKTSYDNTTNYDLGIFLKYTGSLLVSGAYDGSIPTESFHYGNMNFALSGAFGYVTSSNINLPFFDGDWWSIILTKDIHTSQSSQNISYTLRSANKIYSGDDGYSIGYTGSTSISINGSTSSSYNDSWNIYRPYTSSFVPYGVLLGGFSSSLFSGSFQEFRYYSYPVSESTFYDYTMNPSSIEGINITGSLSYFDILNFRAPLGNELEANFSSSLTSSNSSSLYSHHPAVTGSIPTASFIVGGSLYGFGIYGGSIYGGGLTASNAFDIKYYSSSLRKNNNESNIEIYYQDQPIVGIQNPNSNKIQIISSSAYGNILSNKISIQQQNIISPFNSASGNYTKDVNYIEVAFSPQNEINDDIVSSYGYFDLGEYIGDPRYYSSSKVDYLSLNKLRDEYFKKYNKPYNWVDYIRLIKYYDNSLFKLIKDFTPARSGLATGLVIKQHYLERNRYRPPQIESEDLDYTGSINMLEVSGSTAGTFEEFNGITPFITHIISDFTQSWNETIRTRLGLVSESRRTQVEFYNGEFSGSNLGVSNGNLNNNPFLFIDTTINNYEITLYRESLTPENNFINMLTSPDSGELYLYYDSGSNFTPSDVR
jgi:hypothetical protein